MIFKKTKFKGLFIIQPKILSDDRGFFFESFKKVAFDEFVEKKIDFCQENESQSNYGVLRGLHFQRPPYTQSKLVKVIKGKVLDVVVDLRKNSDTFLESFSIVLDDINKQQLFIPKGFAHGFIALIPNTISSYKADNYYNPDFEEILDYKDEKLNIDWKVPYKNIIVSDKDSQLSKDLNNIYKF